MTKEKLAELIVETVDNYSESSLKIAADAILQFLDELEPVNRKKFAKWGGKNYISTPEKCWL